MFRKPHALRGGGSVLDVGAQTSRYWPDQSPGARNGTCPSQGCPTIIQAPLQALPFETQSVGFVRCVHVLETVPSPEAACRELLRVGRSGHLRCARSWLVSAVGASGIRWLVDFEAGVLWFRERTATEPRDLLGLGRRWAQRSRHPKELAGWDQAGIRSVGVVEVHWPPPFPWCVLRAAERTGSSPAAAAKLITAFRHRPARRADRLALRERLQTELARRWR